MPNEKIIIRSLGVQPYHHISQKMHDFTNQRDNTTLDEIWLLEHFPVFTQGRTGKTEHLIVPSNIPIIDSDRGGQISYHGPGQQIMYVLLNLKKRNLSVRELIKLLEQTVINTLSNFNIQSHTYSNARGVYVNEMKICSLGLRIRRGYSLYGLALNINMDLSPFLLINPCGIPNMKMTQISEWAENVTLDTVRPFLMENFLALLKNPPCQFVFD